MADNQFIIGIQEKYPKEILNGRQDAESRVIGCIWKDVLLLDECKLSKENFFTKDGRYMFVLAEHLRKQGYSSLDEITVLSSLNEESLERFEEHGGWEEVQTMIDVINEKNWDTYLDILYRENTIVSLYENGWNLFNEVEFKDKKVKPIDLFRKMTSEQVMDFYESQLTGIGYGGSSKILEDEDLDIDDEFIESCIEGDESGIPFDMAGTDITGSEMSCFPFLSSQINGLLESTFSIVGGYSSCGKTTFFITILMALLHRDRKVLIISNEQKIKVFKMNFMIWILYKHFRYYNLTKTKLQAGNLTEEDRRMVKKVQKYWRDNYKDRVHFTGITDADMNVVKKKIREYVLRDGYDTVLYDTFKLDIDDSSNNKEYISLIKDSRDLDSMAKKYNIIMLASLQLAIHTTGKLFLDASVLSQSKQIKEVLENLLLMRTVYPEELDKDNKKFYCRPYRLKKVNDKWINEDYELDPDGVYRFLFVEKTRSGANSSDTNTAYCYKYDGSHGIFKEICMVRPKHGYIQ